MRTLRAMILLAALTALPAQAAPMLAGSKEPVRIEADNMVSIQKENSVIFTGKVEARQGALLIHADTMTVYYSSAAGTAPAAGATAGKEIKRIVATGNVEITEKEWVATGDRAEYFADERKVVLTGNTKVWQDNNMVTGERFVMYLDEGKSVVEKAEKGGRVKAFFYPGQGGEDSGNGNP